MKHLYAYIRLRQGVSVGDSLIEPRHVDTSSPASLYLPLMLVSLAFSFLTFGLPLYSKAIGADALSIGSLYSVFTLTLVLGRPLVGWLVDRFGRKRFFVLSLITYTLSLILFAFMETLMGLVIARLVQGVASSLFWVSLRSIITDLTTSGTRGQMMGQVQETLARSDIVGVVIGFVMLTLFGELTGWTVAFLLYAAGSAAGAMIAWWTVAETQPAKLTDLQTEAIVSTPLIKLLVSIFIKSVVGSMIAPIFLLYLQEKFTTNFYMLALVFCPGAVIFAVLPSRLGGFSDRIGRVRMIVGGSVMICFVSLLLPSVPSLFWLIVANIFFSVGAAMIGPAETALIGDIMGRTWRGSGYGIYELVVNLGATIGPLVGGWLYDSVSKTAPFYVSAVALLISTVWIWLAFRGKAFDTETKTIN